MYLLLFYHEPKIEKYGDKIYNNKQDWQKA